MTNESFDEFTSLAAVRAQLLGDHDLPRGLPLNYTAESLRRLEEVMVELSLRRFGGLGAGGELELSIAAYVGETLIRAGHGSWVPDPDGFPALVRPARALRLPDVSPFRLMADAVRQRDGRRFVSVFEQWTQAVAVTPDAVPLRRPGRIDRWLAAREAAFDAWVATYAPHGTWDFLPGSLDAVEQVVRGSDPRPQALWDGATWYVGEVFRRTLGGRWHYGFRERNLVEVGPRTATVVPVLAIEIACDQPGDLTRRYNQVAR